MKIYIFSYSNGNTSGQIEIGASNYKKALQWAKQYAKNNSLKLAALYLKK